VEIPTDAAIEEAVERRGGRPSERALVMRVEEDGVRTASDLLAAEEPLEIRLNGERVAVTMRTPVPGQDAELALGFLLGETIVTADEVARISECRSPDGEGGIVDVKLRPGSQPAQGWQRSFYATSSCGICGKAGIDAVRLAAPPLREGSVVAPEVLRRLPGSLLSAQRVFARTGGLHAAGLFDTEGTMTILREDVGRHNAVDKLVGRAAMDGSLPLDDHVLLVSGRASFEIAQKALLAGVPILAAVSAPSSLAVDFAKEAGMTLAGFLRESGFNLYSGQQRVAEPGLPSGKARL
jgi:FdhD protein